MKKFATTENNYSTDFFSRILNLKIRWEKKNKISINVNFDINFGYEILDYDEEGWISFGIEKGELHLIIQNGLMPLMDRNYRRELVPSYLLKRKRITGESQTDEKSGGISGKGGIQGGVPVIKSGIDLKSKQSIQKGTQISDEFIENQYSIYTIGDDNKPIWIFEEVGGNVILLGGITNGYLGSLVINKFPCIVDYEFQVLISDIKLLDWKINKRISRNKKKIALIKIKKHLGGNYINTLSQGRMTYDG